MFYEIDGERWYPARPTALGFPGREWNDTGLRTQLSTRIEAPVLKSAQRPDLRCVQWTPINSQWPVHQVLTRDRRCE